MPNRSLPVRLLSVGVLLAAAMASAADSPLTEQTRVLPIASNAFAKNPINVLGHARSAIVGHGTTQFAAFYDQDSYLVLARRQLGSDTWRTERTEHRGDVADLRSAISLAADGAGYLHVAWNQHDTPLSYARSVAPGALELAPPSPMTGQREQTVSSPQFHLLANGDLLFVYRDAAAQGAVVLNRYSVAARKWSNVHPSLIDGEGKRTAYWDLHVGGDGALHLAWIWRDSPDLATNHDIAYARSKDEGATWTKADGSPLSVPVTAATADYAQRIPTGRSLMHPPFVGTDGKHRPYLGSFWSPTAGAVPQFHVLRYEDSTWTVIPGPAAANPFKVAGPDSQSFPLSRAALLVDNTWDRPALHLLYRDEGRDGRLLLATRADQGPGEWNIRELHHEPMGVAEPAVDPVLWRRFTQVHVLLQPAPQARPSAASGAAGVSSLIWAPAVERMRAQAHAADEPAAAAENSALEPNAVRDLAQRAADWQWANFPPAERRHPRGWEVAPFYIGVLALDRISADERNRERMREQAEAIGWQPHQRFYHADDHCVIQAYYELHQHYREPRMIEASKKRFDQILAQPPNALFDWGTPNHTDRWSWCDALFMAPVAWLQTWKATGDPRYLEYMNREWWITTERLYRIDAGFYFRDESYLDLREPNGRTIHWSRGNGWVFAGLARVLDLFPKDHPDYPRYVNLYREMAAAVLGAQQADGLWRPGLLDPGTHTARETSGSSFYAFGLAWGVNRKLLDRGSAEPAIRRAWNALASCVTPEGKLEHVQPIGAAPEGFDPHHTDIFAVGAFLLAASEVYPLAGGR